MWEASIVPLMARCSEFCIMSWKSNNTDSFTDLSPKPSNSHKRPPGTYSSSWFLPWNIPIPGRSRIVMLNLRIFFWILSLMWRLWTLDTQGKGLTKCNSLLSIMSVMELDHSNAMLLKLPTLVAKENIILSQ